jgi:hypothetical protein
MKTDYHLGPKKLKTAKSLEASRYTVHVASFYDYNRGAFTPTMS